MKQDPQTHPGKNSKGQTQESNKSKMMPHFQRNPNKINNRILIRNHGSQKAAG